MLKNLDGIPLTCPFGIQQQAVDSVSAETCARLLSSLLLWREDSKSFEVKQEVKKIANQASELVIMLLLPFGW